MSYLEHFLKETTSSTRHGSVDSVEGDIEDNRAPSITSSKSNLSELSIVSISQVCVILDLSKSKERYRRYDTFFFFLFISTLCRDIKDIDLFGYFTRDFSLAKLAARAHVFSLFFLSPRIQHRHYPTNFSTNLQPLTVKPICSQSRSRTSFSSEHFQRPPSVITVRP